MNKKNTKKKEKRNEQQIARSESAASSQRAFDYDKLLMTYASFASGSGSDEQLAETEKILLDLCQKPNILRALAEKSIRMKKTELRPYLADFFGKSEVLALLEKEAQSDAFGALAWFRYGGYADLTEKMHALQHGHNDAEDHSQVSPYIESTDSTEAIRADLQFAKKKIKRLEAEIESLQNEAGNEKLISIISSVAPACNELRMYVPAMENAGFDTDTIAGFSGAMDNIANSLIDAGATMIDCVGEEVEFDPAKHYCIKHISKGSLVTVISPGFMVDQDVVVPAVVEEMED